jgi:hypothetical protein
MTKFYSRKHKGVKYIIPKPIASLRLFAKRLR